MKCKSDAYKEIHTWTHNSKLVESQGQKILTTGREKQVTPYSRGSIPFLADFPSETIKARRQGNDKIKMLKKIYNPVNQKFYIH